VDEILAMIDSSGAHYHHHDALGNVIALTNSSGALGETYRYDAFGKATVTNASTSVTADTSFFGNRILYTGGEWVAEARLYDYRNRVYSAALGRFMQTDPILFEAGDVNVYRYVGNNPALLVDPDGKIVPLVVVGLGILGGIVFDYVVDKIKNRNVDNDYSPDGGTAANAATGAATSSTSKTQVKPRTGVSGGGRSGSGTSVASNLNHDLIKNPVVRNRVSSCLRKVPYVGVAISAAQLGDAIVNPTSANE